MEVDPGVDPRVAMEERFRRALPRLTLKTTLMGNPALANLNDKILRVGEVMVVDSVTFTVVEIGGESITVRAEDADLNVVVEEDIFVDRRP